MPISLASLCRILPDHVLDACSLHDIDFFLRLCVYYTPEIRLSVPLESQHPPYRLPLYLTEFLVQVLCMDSQTVMVLWDSLKDIVWEWEGDKPNLSVEEKSQIDVIGSRTLRKGEKLSSTMFYPPVSRCSFCEQKLDHISRVIVRYYSTLGAGGLDACEGFSTSLYCKGCKTRYYYNYYTKDGTRHFYSSEIPDVIQLEDHAFISTELCELFTSFMLLAWVSSQNCGHILNASVKRLRKASRYSDTSEALTISSEQVFRAFVLNALLRDCSERGIPLYLPDKGDHDDRLKAAMELRTNHIVERGQMQRMHACDKCEKPIPLEDGTLRSFRAAVTDGITLGRPCCKVHNCSIPLASNRDHYCLEHQECKSTCVIAGCGNKASGGFQTCTAPAHRAIEKERKERGRGFFQLKERLHKQFNITQVPDSFPKSDSDIPEMEDENYDNPNVHGSDTRKSETGNKPRKAQFSRRRTHNEQLVVACCGVIVGRATMYGAEAVSGVKDFLISVYQRPENLPDVLFYDNNCQLQLHLKASPLKDRTFFKGILLPVDVFHFKSKHSTKDEFCQKHCNPAMFPELYNQEKDEWVFNSSIAEQVNAWLGGYLSIVRDMLAHRYEFFLDEMIKRRNEMVVDRLYSLGCFPYVIPE